MPFYEAPRVVKLIEVESGMVVARGWVEADWGVNCLMGVELKFGNKKIFWIWKRRKGSD